MKFNLTAAFLFSVIFNAAALPAPEPSPARLQRRTCNFPTAPLLRADHPLYTDHFYTTNAAEMNTATTVLGYDAEGTAAIVHPDQTPITIPLYRLYQPTSIDHFYTTSADERDSAASTLGYSIEGIAAYVYETQLCDTVPLYRLYQPSKVDHFYTTSADERDNAVNTLGYSYEGIAAYVNPQA